MDFMPWMLFRVDNHDYIMGWESDLSKKIELQAIPAYYYFSEWNQKEINNSSCVIHWMLWALWRTVNEDFTENRLELLNLAKEQWLFQEWYWMYFNDWCDLVRKWWNNNNPDKKVITFRLQYWTEDFNTALENWYRLAWWYKRSQSYIEDWQDWVVDWDSFNDTSWWHCVSIQKWTNWYQVEEINSYKWVLKVNRYNIAHLDKLVDKLWWNEFYIFITINQMTEIFKDVTSDMPWSEAVKFLKDNEIIKGYSDWTFAPNQPISRLEVAIMLQRFYEKFCK